MTLARRFNGVATTGRPDPATEARRAVDPRQHTEFAGAWTLASVNALSVPGVAGLTYYETAGERGLVADPASLPGGLSAAGRVLGHLAARGGRSVLRAEAPSDLAVLPLATGGQEVELLLGNLDGQDREVLVRWNGQSRSVPLGGWAVVRLQLG